MKISSKRRHELYSAIHNAIVDVRIRLDLQPPEDAVLAKVIDKIWHCQTQILKILYL